MVGDNVKQVRKLRKLTLEQLAEKIGSTSGTLSHIEKGSRKPSLDMLEKIAAALEVDMPILLQGDSQFVEDFIDAVNKKVRTVDSDEALDYLATAIKSTVGTGSFKVEEQAAKYGNFPIEDIKPVTCKLVKVPVLGKIPAGVPVEAKVNIIDYVTVPETEVANGSYFYLQVEGDSMVNSGIRNGYRVLVKRQPDVESGEIAVVRVNSHDATLKRVKKIDGQVILYPDNPNYEPIFIKEEGAEIIGKVVKVEFDPNKRY